MKSLFENYVFFKNQASSFILLAILNKTVYSIGTMLRTYWCSNYSHRRSESLKFKKKPWYFIFLLGLLYFNQDYYNLNMKRLILSANTSNTTRSIKKKGLQINFIIIFLNFDLAERRLSLGSVISLHCLSHLPPLGESLCVQQGSRSVSSSCIQWRIHINSYNYLLTVAYIKSHRKSPIAGPWRNAALLLTWFPLEWVSNGLWWQLLTR